jgi:Tol biopolymer transport system component
MPLSPGTRLGGYEVLGGLGAGGMGEVYRARDPVLQRDVAIKIVHPDVCHHPDSLARLRREARALAALNHPHVATLHELAEFGGSCGLVMELVDGDTLAELLTRRRLSIDETLRLGAQIASALEAAHDRGLVHRDLKPANIKVTTHSTIKVLDFGLARTEAESPDAAASTLMTNPGMVVGTAAYMSPEQARGAAVDRRTDLWAFGCVLFEMLSGRRPFDGPSHSDIVAAVLDKEPEWSALPANTPLALHRLIRRCLQKDVRRRLRDAGDARLELEEALEPSGTGAAPPRRDALPSWIAMAGVLLAGASLGIVAALLWRGAPVDDRGEIRFSMTLPDDERLAQSELGALAMAPDGRSIAYVASRGSTTQLLLRRLDAATSTPLQGTVSAISPFFSPDGEWIAFFADGKLKKAPAGGGSVVTIADAGDGLGGSWGDDGTIVFAAATGSPLQQVAANGGPVSRASTLDVDRGEFSHRWPEFLPGGDVVLFTVGTVGEWDEAEIVAQSLRTGARTTVIKGGTNPRYLADDRLLYAHDGAIWMVKFDPRGLTTSGTPVEVVPNVAVTADGAAAYGISRRGATVFVPADLAAAARRLVIVDRAEVTPLAAPLHRYVTPRVSPNGRNVLVGVADDPEHIWSYDLNAGALTQLTFEGSNRGPIWSADGQRVAFSSNRGGAFNLFAASATADGAAERLAAADSLQLPGSWSPDGRLAFMEQHASTGRDIWLLDRTGTRTVLANSPADESAPRFSPDGRWIAFVSNESGEAAIYVRSPGAPIARRVSRGPALEPVWRRDGAVLYYRSGGELIATPIGGDGTPQPERSRVVFSGAAEPGNYDAAGFDVLPGDGRFVMITRAGANTTPGQLRFILNWLPGSPD